MVTQMRRSDEYWAKRLLSAGDRRLTPAERKLKEIYVNATAKIKKEIEAYIGRYGTDDIYALLSKAQTLSQQKFAATAYADSDKKNYPSWFKRNAYRQSKKTKITRVDKLMFEIDLILSQASAREVETLADLLSKVYSDGYNSGAYNSAIESGRTRVISKPKIDAIKRAIDSRWLDGNFKTRSADNAESVSKALQKDIPSGLILGRNPKEIATMINKRTGTGYKNALRLARTEVSHVLNDANFQAMEDNDIERYVYTAVLDFKTSEICRDLDGKDFALKDKRQGINAPPMHPYCRSTTVPMVDDRGERLAKDKNGKYFYVPENMTYKEYAEKYLS